MAGNEYNQVRPHQAQDRKAVAAGSPLAVIGIFLETLRERFREDANAGFVWREDPSTTELVIEAGYNVNVEERNYVRALFVNRISTTPSTMVIGNKVGVHLPDHLEGFVAMMSSTITIDCVSKAAGESMMLGDIVQHFILASGNILEAMYGFHDVGMPELGQTAPYTHDQDKFSSTVSFVVQYHARWSTVKIRPLLAQVAVRAVDGVTHTDAAEHFEGIASDSMRRSARWMSDPDKCQEP